MLFAVKESDRNSLHRIYNMTTIQLSEFILETGKINCPLITYGYAELNKVWMPSSFLKAL